MRLHWGSIPLAMLLALSMFAQQASQPKYQQNPPSAQPSPNAQKGSTTKGASTAQTSGRYSYSPQFNGAERDTVRTCMTGTYGNTGVKARPLPAALDSQVQVGSQLSAGLQKRLQPLPSLCTSQLTMTLPANWSRAVLGRHVVLLDPNQKIVDMFDLD